MTGRSVAIGVFCAEKRTQRIHPVTPLTRRYQIRRLFFAAFRVALEKDYVSSGIGYSAFQHAFRFVGMVRGRYPPRRAVGDLAGFNKT